MRDVGSAAAAVEAAAEAATSAAAEVSKLIGGCWEEATTHGRNGGTGPGVQASTHGRRGRGVSKVTRIVRELVDISAGHVSRYCSLFRDELHWDWTASLMCPAA